MEPTERQLRYARDLGIKIPDGATREDISALIDKYNSSDFDATDDERELAEQYGLQLNRYSGKRAIFAAIFRKLRQSGSGQELAAWFAYCVALDYLAKDSHLANIDPADAVFLEIGSELAQDAKLVKSLLRYDADNTRIFGERAGPDGSTHCGGSQRTAVYKRSIELLRDHRLIPETSAAGSIRSRRATTSPHQSTRKQRPGSTSALLPLVIVIATALIVAFIALSPGN